MENTSLRTGLVLVCVIVIVTAISGRILYVRHADAAEAPPAPVEASETWLKNHAPRIRELKAELEPLEAQKNQHVQAIAVFGYEVNWDTLEAQKAPEPKDF
ncbi:MAG TPA: hypothetical protein VGN57_01530 [Pirellulaceae bacterium]|jgi:hypothetical protein|nr:hypothetical protein [Pirellulaceae bacterium]